MSDVYSVTSSIADDGVAVVEFAAPPANTLSFELLRELVDAIVAAGENGARAVVMASPGRHFCSGAQLADSAAKGSAAGADELYGQAVRLIEQPLPLIAPVQGAAVGGGLGLALVADHVLVAPETKLWPNFARLGTHHGFGLSATLPRRVGSRVATALMMTARDVRGVEACEMGLADQLVTDGDLRDAAISVAREIAGNAPLAVRSIRATLRRRYVDDFKAAVQHEAVAQTELAGTEDFREGVASVTERRTPNFVGR